MDHFQDPLDMLEKKSFKDGIEKKAEKKQKTQFKTQDSVLENKIIVNQQQDSDSPIGLIENGKLAFNSRPLTELSFALTFTTKTDEVITLVETLGQLGTELTHQLGTLALVLKAAGDANKDVRAAAVMALATMGTELARQPQALMLVLKAADDLDEYVRTAGVKALATMGPELAHQPIQVLVFRERSALEILSGLYFHADPDFAFPGHFALPTGIQRHRTRHPARPL